ncbi:retrovirus-related pol polyprotein from transposon TNT 1-94 [Tanacetum coccineum]
MTTLAEHITVAGAENHPPMLEKSMYDSWASRIRLFIKGKKNGRMMLDSIDNGPLVYPTVKENGQTRPKKYSELTEAQQLQDDCDVQATNIFTVFHPMCSSLYPPPQQFTPVYTAPIHHQHHHTPVNLQQQSVSPQPFISLPVTQQSQAEFPQLNSGLAVPTFQQGEDPIDCINKAMAFLSVASRFPPSNNQLITSSNPRNRATIQDGRVTVQQIQERQTQSFVGSGNIGIATTSSGNYATSQPKVVKCYNCPGERHMAKQCTQPKKPRSSAWFKEKLMLAEAQEAGQILDEEQLAFIADPGIAEVQVAHQIIPQNSAFQTQDLDAYDSDCDDISSAKAVLMVNLSSCDYDVLSEVPYSDTYPNDVINQDESQDAVIQDTNSFAPNDLLVLSLVEQMTNHVPHLDKENQTNKMINEPLTAGLERYKERVAIFEQRLNVDLNKREKLIDSQMDELIRNRNAKLAAFQQEIDTLKETLSNHVKEKESL